jgi:thiol:disulfide interchange protein DsbC
MLNPVFKSLTICSAICILCSLIGCNGSADDNKNNDKNETKIRTVLKSTLEIGDSETEKQRIGKINNSNIAGLYEVEVDKKIIYSNADASYIIIGDLIDTKNKNNITQQKIAKLEKIQWIKLPFQDSIFWQKGFANDEQAKNASNKYQIAIFSDPNCGYCKRLEQEIQKLDKVAVYTFMMPILAQDSVDKSQNIWCSSNNPQQQAKTWLNWMLNATAPNNIISKPDAQTTKCLANSPIEKNVNLGRTLGVNGTPAIFFIDGSKVGGAMNAQEINAKFASLK